MRLLIQPALVLSITTAVTGAISCEVTYRNVVDGYASLGVGEVGSYQDVGAASDDPARRALVREGMYVAHYDEVHVFGTQAFISYVFTLEGCVVTEVRWTREGDELNGTPS